jgi:hypothetical protein
MPADLDRMFSAMRTDSDGAPLPAPAGLRTRGDRRTRVRAVMGLIAVAVLVGGTAVGTRQLLAGPTTPVITDTPPPPSAPPKPTPSMQVSPDPAPSQIAVPQQDPTGSPVHRPGCDEVLVYPYVGPRHAGQALPRSVMLRPADLGECYVLTADRPGYPVYDSDVGPAPDVCLDRAPYPADAKRVAGRFRTFVSGPESGGFEAVTRYRDGGAAEFLDEIRARVAKCASFTGGDPPGQMEARIEARNFAGDESLLVYVGMVGTSYPSSYVGVVRQGNLVAVVELFYDLGSDRDDTLSLTRKATGRL